MVRFSFPGLSSRPLLLVVALLAPVPALAQDNNAGGTPPGQVAPETDPLTGMVDFSADQLEYDDTAEIVTAIGRVEMTRDGSRLKADKVVWNRKTGGVQAEGNVTVISDQGDTAYGDSIEVQDTLKDGIVSNLLLVLADGGRLVSNKADRVNGVTTLERAAYTPCSVVDSKGCDHIPVWQINAVRVTHDPIRHRIYYRQAQLSLLGLPILYLPALSHPDGTLGGGSGLLVPNVQYDRVNGIELAMPYYFRLAPNRDLTITPHVYSDVLPAIEARFRHLTASGAYQVNGMLTRFARIGSANGSTKDYRGYIDASGKFQLSPEWTVTGSSMVATDNSFLRRYDISRDRRLRSTLKAERIDSNSYLSIAGWAVQDLRSNSVQGRQPIALPALDYRRRFNNAVLGGNIELQANSLSILRTAGQDTQRAFTSAKWEQRSLTGLGQELTLTAFGRADLYNANDTLSTVTAVYRGQEGWNSRLIGAMAADMRWPFSGPAFGGTQRITPRVQIVASPKTSNMRIPNEDSRAIDLEDSNLFALNRFPGYDRWEDGVRATLGAEYALDLPHFSLRSVIGQSYRLNSRPSIFPNGTGLTNRTSDVVGRTTLRYDKLVSLTHRYRLDKDSLAVRRNEVDATIGTDRTYASVGYLRLNRDITSNLEDLRDREEIRLGGRIAFHRYWSVFGSTVIDLTSKREDALSLADGYEPVRHRLGFAYEDDCVEFGVTWRRDYIDVGADRNRNTFQLRLAFKNLGR